MPRPSLRLFVLSRRSPPAACLGGIGLPAAVLESGRRKELKGPQLSTNLTNPCLLSSALPSLPGPSIATIQFIWRRGLWFLLHGETGEGQGRMEGRGCPDDRGRTHESNCSVYRISTTYPPLGPLLSPALWFLVSLHVEPLRDLQGKRYTVDRKNPLQASSSNPSMF